MPDDHPLWKGGLVRAATYVPAGEMDFLRDEAQAMGRTLSAHFRAILGAYVQSKEIRDAREECSGGAVI